MAKFLKVIAKDKCIGCEMCVLECQRQAGKVGLNESYIRILRDIKKGTDFEISIDPEASKLNLKKIVSSCPREVFSELEESDN